MGNCFGCWRASAADDVSSGTAAVSLSVPDHLVCCRSCPRQLIEAENTDRLQAQRERELAEYECKMIQLQERSVGVVNQKRTDVNEPLF